MNNRKMELLSGSLACLLFFVGLSTAQTWSQLPTVGSPPVTGVGGVGYDGANNRLIAFFPGTGGAQVWVLTNANGLGGTSNWIQLTPNGTAPTNSGEASVVYDSRANQLIVYGGCVSNCGSPLSDVFVLHNANGLAGTPAWSQTTTSPPEARENQSAVYNSSNRRMIAFGGGLAFFGTDQNDTRVLVPFNASSSNWSTFGAAGDLPEIREGNTAIYDQAHNLMTIFGGDAAVSTCCPYDIVDYNDVWVLSDADGSGTGTPTWRQLTPTGAAPPARSNQSAVYDSARNIMYVFGGLQFSNATQTQQVLGDLWKLTNANGRGASTPKWTQIGQLGTPPGALFSHGAVFDRVNQRMIVIGGGDRNFQNINLTFVLNLLQH